MNLHRRPAPLTMLSATILAAFATIHCQGKASPMAPDPALSVISGVSLDSTTMAVGATVQGRVNLASPASADGASIAMSSSDTNVATVPAALTIPAGGSMATFTVSGMAAGTATITASLNGSSQSPALTVTGPVTGPVALSAISLSSSSVVSGGSVTGTATLTGGAPAGGATVSLSGSGPVTVPATVLIPAGSVSATFTVSAAGGAGAFASTISGSYGGGSASASLSVTPVEPVAPIASFSVIGVTAPETCSLIGFGDSLDCSFDGSSSTAPGTIVRWDWSYSVSTTLSMKTLGPKLTLPLTNCSLIPPPPIRPGLAYFTMIVTLVIHDSLGNVSEPAVHPAVRLLPPMGVCGY